MTSWTYLTKQRRASAGRRDDTLSPTQVRWLGALLLATQLPMIAFVTAYDEYAVRAFELNAVDYLLKPVHPSRLRRVIEQLRQIPSTCGGATRPDRGSHDVELAVRTEF